MKGMKDISEYSWSLPFNVPREVKVVDGITPQMYVDYARDKKNIEVYIKPIKTVVLVGKYLLDRQHPVTAIFMNNGMIDTFYDFEMTTYGLHTETKEPHIMFKSDIGDVILALKLTEPISDEDNGELIDKMLEQISDQPEAMGRLKKLIDNEKVSDDVKRKAERFIKGETCDCGGVEAEYRIED